MSTSPMSLSLAAVNAVYIITNSQVKRMTNKLEGITTKEEGYIEFICAASDP
jgi:hypothetical protein